MSYFNAGRSRSFGGRFQQRQNRGPQRSFIHPSKYVNVAVEPQEEVMTTITHSFADFGLQPQIMTNLQQRGYDTPTLIQDQAIPALMEGRDVVGIANTGSGKTAAFLLPLIDKISRDPNQGALIVAPTRELAVQILDEFRLFAAGLKISVCLCIGGANLDRQMDHLRNNPHFVIGTPGRLKDLINRNAMDTSMFTNIVLDEVDRMLDIGFVRDIKFLIAHLPQERQSAFFSATTTRETDEIMRTLLRDPVSVSVKTSDTSEHISQDVIRLKPGENKIDKLHQLLTQQEFSKVIVFGRTKHGINKLEEHLANRGVRVSSIHGNKTQNARQRSLDLFKRGNVQALLATDVAARGIDIEGVTHVINFDEPQSYEDYIHRIGRTGRAGRRGKALTFIL
jgi:ATP-dependent RNA helicase RhlE